tara:strand:- start:72 stop:458 length:387 start_codon:yes stop_codon:yes gene_type:complete
MKTKQLKIHLPCLPLIDFWQKGIEDINMTSFIRDDEGYFGLDRDFNEYKNLLVSIDVGARLDGEPFVISIDKATYIADIVIPVALGLHKVFTDNDLLQLHKPIRRPGDLVFELITIEENNVVDIFFGS